MRVMLPGWIEHNVWRFFFVLGIFMLSLLLCGDGGRVFVCACILSASAGMVLRVGQCMSLMSVSGRSSIGGRGGEGGEGLSVPWMFGFVVEHLRHQERYSNS